MPRLDADGSREGKRAPADQRRMYRMLWERTERHYRSRQRMIERLVQRQRERRRRSFPRPGR
jgi:hypothetical protein